MSQAASDPEKWSRDTASDHRCADRCPVVRARRGAGRSAAGARLPARGGRGPRGDGGSVAGSARPGRDAGRARVHHGELRHLAPLPGPGARAGRGGPRGRPGGDAPVRPGAFPRARHGPARRDRTAHAGRPAQRSPADVVRGDRSGGRHPAGRAPARLPSGRGLSLARLYEADARILLLGTGYESCTAFHLAEYRLPSPPLRHYRCVVARAGRRQWWEYEDVELDDGDFAALGQDLERADVSGAVRGGRVASAPGRLLRLRTAVDFATVWLRRHRLPVSREGSPHPGPPPRATARA